MYSRANRWTSDGILVSSFNRTGLTGKLTNRNSRLRDTHRFRRLFDCLLECGSPDTCGWSSHHRPDNEHGTLDAAAICPDNN